MEPPCIKICLVPPGFFPFSFDYLKITDSNNLELGKYCDRGFGWNQSTLVTGDYANITFKSDLRVEGKGFQLYFNVLPQSGK